MRFWIVLGFGLLIAACSPDVSETEHNAVDSADDYSVGSSGEAPGSHGVGSDSNDGSAGSNDEARQNLLEDVQQGNLSTNELTAALDYGHIDVTQIEQGYSADKLLDLVRQQLRPAHASTPDECRVIGVGSRPCGGPERHMIYSTANTNEAVLLKLVDAYNRKSAADNARAGMVSDCSVRPEPVIVLHDGMCRAAQQQTH